jgi:D-galactarolactone isomerase
MSDRHVDRRTVLKGAGVAALALAGASVGSPAAASQPWAPGGPTAPLQEVPFSAGTARPRLRVPANATDSHMHIFDPARFPYPSPTATPPPAASVADYRLLQQRLGLTRVVVVTPSNYATDNRATLDAIAQFGPVARGVAVIDETFSAGQLHELHDGGIRGIRFNVTRPGGAGAELIRPLAERISSLGWHVQIHMTAEGIVENSDHLRDLPVELVVDHMGRIPGAAGVDHPAYGVLRTLIDQGHTWVKVSGVYHDSSDGPPTYADRSRLAAAFVKAAPERMVWGTDWPHPSASRGEVPMPDDAAMLDLLGQWAPDECVREQILVQNPAQLYCFPSSRGRR